MLSKECSELLERWPLPKKFKLKPNSTAIVVGAYKGLAMELLVKLYPRIHKIIGFEPQNWAFEEATSRLEKYGEKCQVLPVGLGTVVQDGFQMLPMGEWHTDACSFVNVGPGSRDQGLGFIVDTNWYFQNMLKIDHIDLMVMNVEGYEWELLPYLKDTGWLDKIDRLAIQWHLGLGANPKQHEDINAAIDELSGFSLAYSEPPAWTYHVRKTNDS